MNNLINRLNEKNIKELRKIYYKMTNKHINQNKKYIIKELLKPFEMKYKMKRQISSTNTQSKRVKLQKYLKDISLFYQLEMDNKIITLLGEYHNLKCLCKQVNTISVETYILEYLRKKPNTKVLLEISNKYTQQQINGLGSFNLVNTYQTLVNNGFKKNIIYFDVRYFYISKYMFIIANDPQTFSQMSSKEIIKNIILPFQKFWEDKRNSFQQPQNTTNILLEKINYITPNIQQVGNNKYNGEMMKQMVDNFYMIEKEIDKLPKETIRDRLLNTWKQVMDWECIYNIFKSKTDCIVLTGRKHTENYINILNGIGSSVVKEASCKKISPNDKIYNSFSGTIDSKGNKCLCDCISI